MRSKLFEVQRNKNGNRNLGFDTGQDLRTLRSTPTDQFPYDVLKTCSWLSRAIPSTSVIYFGLLESSSQGLLTCKLMSGVTTTCVCPIMLVCTLMKDLCMFIYDGLATTANSSDQPGYMTQLTVWLSKTVRVYRLSQCTAIVATKMHD